MQEFWGFWAIALLSFALASTVLAKKNLFLLKDEDPLCFYGDRVATQRFYPAEAQRYVIPSSPIRMRASHLRWWAGNYPSQREPTNARVTQ
jgi:hypothetical protein